MQDHHLKDIVKEIQKELPKGVPYVVVYAVCRFFLKMMYWVMRKEHARMRITAGDINQVYEDYNIQQITSEQLSDLDETHEASTPYIVLRSKINPKRIHYPRLGPNPIYKRKSG